MSGRHNMLSIKKSYNPRETIEAIIRYVSSFSIVFSSIVSISVAQQKEKRDKATKSTKNERERKVKSPHWKKQNPNALTMRIALPSKGFWSADYENIAKIATPVIGEAAVYATYSPITTNKIEALRSILDYPTFLSMKTL